VLLVLSGCGPSLEEIQNNAKESMQSHFDTDANMSGYKIKVDGVDAIKENGNTYRGVARVQVGGEEYPVNVSIVADGEKLLWSAERGAFIFLMRHQKEKEPAPNYGAELRWVVQVASLSDASVADGVVETLTSAGFKTYKRQSKEGMNRVFVGPVSDRAEADGLREQLSGQHNLNGFVARYQEPE
jgi:hypothetical protein